MYVCLCVCVLLCYPLAQWLTDCDPKARPGPHLFCFFLTFILYWTTVDLQCCVSFSCVCVCGSRSVVSNSLRPHELWLTRLPYPWNSLGKNTVGCPTCFCKSSLTDAHLFTYCLWQLSHCSRVHLLQKGLYGSQSLKIYYLALYRKSLSAPIVEQCK